MNRGHSMNESPMQRFKATKAGNNVKEVIVPATLGIPK